MVKTAVASKEIYLFEDGLPFEAGQSFQSECPRDKKVKAQNLFKFSRKRGDFQISVVAAGIAMFFFMFFWTKTGWEGI